MWQLVIIYAEKSRKRQQSTAYQRTRLDGITESKAAEKAKRMKVKKKKKKINAKIF